MNYNDYYPIGLDEQEKFIRDYFLSHKEEDILWISENRDFAEQERYKQKDEVDVSLTNSSVVLKERQRIEKIFESDEDMIAALNYDKRLKTNLKELTNCYLSGLDDGIVRNLDEARMVWSKIKVQSDIDNAHAMYLSSDNWPFSVFHKIIDKMSEILEGDFEVLSKLLTAGMQDVRTSIFANLSGRYEGADRKEFVHCISKQEEYINDDGVILLFAYIAETGAHENLIDSNEIKENYEKTKTMVLDELDEEKKDTMKRLLEAYELLYADRVTYDIYEYYGFYTFIRHALILKTKKIIEQELGKEEAERFCYLASTYQFHQINF